ncbi:MAG: hypothetical protein KGY99_10845 [Phycisphaerae bacterium]|nr:hypothetical protein [Phycisphaerae bacterium]
MNATTIAPVMIGAVFAIAGAALWYFGTRPVVFDKHRAAFWKGKRAPDRVFDRDRKNGAKLEDIHAIQLLCEYIPSSGSRRSASFYSYELNLVLHDGSRLNVTDHSKLHKLRKDAKALAAFLDVPVWDAI